MIECVDKNIGELIYAFELDQLDDERRRQFEEHLFKCDYCFEKAQKFLDVVKLLKYDPELKEHIQKLADNDINSGAESKLVSISGKEPKYWRLLLVAAVLLIVLVFQPWQIEFNSTKEAVAYENLLAIMYFDNMAEPDDKLRRGEIVTDLLINNLSESEYVTVVSSQRLYDILKLLGHEGLKRIDKDIASQVARKSNSKYMLTGSLIQIEPNIVLTAQIVDVKSGNIIASQRVIGDDNDIFPAIDKMSEEIKVDLSLPQQAYKESDRNVCDISSCSMEAYNYYLEGLENYYKYYYPEAAISFAKAIESDSTFCMAYYNRAWVTYGKERLEMAARAFELRRYSSKKEQRYIEALHCQVLDSLSRAASVYHKIILDYPDEKEAHFRLGILFKRISQQSKAIEQLQESINIDPYFKAGYNELAGAYDQMGDFDKCIETYDKYIKLAPNEPNAYDGRGEAYIVWGYPDKGIADLKKVIELKPDFYHTLLNLAALYIIDANYLEADSLIEIVIEKGSRFEKYDAEFLRCLIPFKKGQVNTTIKRLNDFEKIRTEEIKTDRGAIFDAFSKDWVLVSIYLGLGQKEKALELFTTVNNKRKESSGPSRSYTGFYVKIILLAEAGYFEKASEAVEEFKQYIGDGYSHVFYYQYLIAAGALEYNKGNYNKAIVLLEEARSRHDLRFAGKYRLHFYLGKTYQAINDYQNAIEEYNMALSRYTYSRLYQFITDIDVYYNLGLCYEQTGDTENAKKNYRIILDLWKDADEELKQKYGYDVR